MNKIAVLKFGGTSVSTADGRALVVQHIASHIRDGFGVVAVISAMGRKGDAYATDTLLGLTREEAPNTCQRESDLLFCCGELIAGALIAGLLQDAGHHTHCLSGGQAGIVTDSGFGAAKVQKVIHHRISDLLDTFGLAVVCGGQGMDEQGNLTSLGRGSGDTTCLLLARALRASIAVVYTDVPGIMSADPRLVANAVILPQLDYSSCRALSLAGAQVLHPHAVDLAAASAQLSLYVRSTFSAEKGTLLVQDPPAWAQGNPVAVSGRSVSDLESVVSLIGPGLQLSLPEVTLILSRGGISVGQVEKTPEALSFRVGERDYLRSMSLLHDFLIYDRARDIMVRNP